MEWYYKLICCLIIGIVIGIPIAVIYFKKRLKKLGEDAPKKLEEPKLLLNQEVMEKK